MTDSEHRIFVKEILCTALNHFCIFKSKYIKRLSRTDSRIIEMLVKVCFICRIKHIQGARGICARFLILSPASAIRPIMTKFSQYTPHSTCYSQPVPICRQD